MPKDILGWYEDAIQKPHGMILVTGPTGSGKTTTLYTALNRLNTPDVNIMTCEDPVEIRLPMVRQVQVNHELGLTFASALRSFLRQDPDIILVGEIRDQETARIAVQAALTGHLVFSTLHTNDAVGSISRLKDFGLPAFAINSSLLCVLAQRLVRKICSQCIAPEDDASMLAHVPGLTGFKKGCGCQACKGAGYRGRMGVFEMMRMTPTLQTLVEKNATSNDILRVARSEGMRSLWENGIEKAMQGLTSLSECSKLRAEFEVEEEASPGQKEVSLAA
jgi:type II secretory ATPase GspE/PulE/Tfp pilus assembly ATPase PilB-like protein